jgi:sarcosine oxidase subunit gamma
MSYEVDIHARPPESLFDIRGEESTAAACLAAAGLALPDGPNRASGDGEALACWVGPRHWLLLAPLEREDELHARFAELVAGRPASATRVTDAYAGFQVGGPDADDVLAQGCALDLRPRQAPPGLATFTELFGARGLLCKPAEDGPYRLYVDRSLGHYVVQWLHRAAGRRP